mmetsp:Transcript_7549/g.17637  ORF Transcript_7549/g.17637 Transcript_7549/m.17637 type:complete len:227 (-) Transcript_7549:168-848(-)
MRGCRCWQRLELSERVRIVQRGRDEIELSVDQHEGSLCGHVGRRLQRLELLQLAAKLRGPLAQCIHYRPQRHRAQHAHQRPRNDLDLELFCAHGRAGHACHIWLCITQPAVAAADRQRANASRDQEGVLPECIRTQRRMQLAHNHFCLLSAAVPFTASRGHTGSATLVITSAARSVQPTTDQLFRLLVRVWPVHCTRIAAMGARVQVCRERGEDDAAAEAKARLAQ